MDEHPDFLIKSAAMLAKDLLADNRFMNNFTSVTQTTEADSDDDLDLFFYSQLMKKRKVAKNEIRTGISTKNRKRISFKGPNSKTKDGSQGPTTNHLFLKFLRECEDITFENQFKMTRSTFQVRIYI